MNKKLTYDELRLFQSLPLEDKIRKSTLRIRDWYEHWCGSVYVSFSGGKDSTALLHLVRSLYPDVPAVYCDTGLEYPEIREFVLRHENITIIHPTMSFREVLERYGYPVISKEQSSYIYEVRTTKSKYLRDYRLYGKRMENGTRGRLGRIQEKWKFLIDAPFKISDICCDILKKKPFNTYEKESGRYMITGEMACESQRRKTNYLMYGCNGFQLKRPKSTPIAFWTEQDVLEYLHKHEIPYSSVYGEIIKDENNAFTLTGCKRTGCMFCMFGVHLEKGTNQFVRMKQTHPKLWSYCINTLGLGNVMDYIGVYYGDRTKTDMLLDGKNSVLVTPDTRKEERRTTS